MRLLSYNILAPCHANLHHIHTLSWDERKNLVVAQIEETNPHIICLQEVENKGFVFLDSCLRDKGYRGLFALKGFGKLEGPAIFFRFEEFLFVGAEILFFHDYYPDKKTNAPFTSGDNALFLYLKTPRGLAAIVNTHIHSYFPEDNLLAKKTNELQLQELFTVYLPERSYIDHWIVAGDFNTEEVPPSYLQRNRLLDAHTILSHPTFDDRKIDFIFHSDTLHAKPFPMSHSPASDHTPLLVNLSFTI